MTDCLPLPDWVRAHAAEIVAWPAIATNDAPACAVAICDREAFAIGLCQAHYRRAKRAHRAEFRIPTDSRLSSGGRVTRGTRPAQLKENDF